MKMLQALTVPRVGIVLCTLFILIAPEIVAQNVEARITSVRGRVEVRPNGGEWENAEEGMILSVGSSVSTGFNAEAVLELGASSLTVRSLSRLTIEELIEREGLVETDLNLPVGRVRGEVRRTEGLQNDFTIRGAVATAAVRGTDFDFDGVNLRVEDGQVSVANRLGHQVAVARGESSSTIEGEEPSSGDVALEQDSNVEVFVGGGEDGIATRRSRSSSLSLTIEFGAPTPVEEEL